MTTQKEEKTVGAVSATAGDAVPCSVPADSASHDAIMPERSLAGTATMKNRSAGARDASRSELTDSGSRYRSANVITRSQAAQRLLALRNIRDAKEACEMGATALQRQVLLAWLWWLSGAFIGFGLGLILYAA